VRLGGKAGLEGKVVEDELELVNGASAGEGASKAVGEVVADACEGLVEVVHAEGFAFFTEVRCPRVVEGV